MCVFVCLFDVHVLVLLLANDIEVNPGPTKKCPQCNASLHVHKADCTCGYRFSHNDKNTETQRDLQRCCPATKQCPQCNAYLHVCKAECTCGYNFSKQCVTPVIDEIRIGKRKCVNNGKSNNKRNKMVQVNKRLSEKNSKALEELSVTESKHIARNESNKITQSKKHAIETIEDALKQKAT